MLYDFCFFPQLTPAFAGIWKESVFLSKSDLGSNFGIVQGCLSFIAMHLQVKKKKQTIIMEIPARDEDGGGEAE